MPREMIDSSAIEAVQYDAARQRLDIELTNRRVYRYFDVPLEVYRAFMAADSKGRYYNDEIRDEYEYVQLR
jgi:KTSC domain